MIKSKHQAEQEIQQLIADIDSMRLEDKSPQYQAEFIQKCEKAIARLKIITGPRNIIGTGNIIIPTPGALGR